MSKQRMIRDSFWTDSYIERLTPDEKLLFLYLLTNPLCNVAGVYEIRTKRIGFETGYDIEVVESILGRFERDKKILRHNDWVVLINHIKNQSLNPSIIQGCQRIFDELPPDIKSRVTGWVQAGLLNLTILNLTLPNLTEESVVEEPPKKPPKEKTTKHGLGEFENVFLTTEEYGKLNESLGMVPTDNLIAEMSSYVASTGKQYKSHYAALQTWARRRIQEHAVKLQSTKPKMI